ncbi:MAG: agmatine deiminase family protein [Gammaproteobacteria bacterium]|nr:agmatine deiminase family protein [Gammaproteobacteria bacterium]
MSKFLAKLAPALALCALMNACASEAGSVTGKRVPAEWEPQEAIWLQWPGSFERVFQPAFAKMSAIISRYQKLNILCHSSAVEEQARRAIIAIGGDPDHSNIEWHHLPNDSAWMRDNGPLYLFEDGQLRIQNWGFNAWGGAFGKDIPYRQDNQVPSKVGERLDLSVEVVDIVHERGNLEFNGVDSVLLNWSTLGDPERNPGYTREQAERDLKHYFGVSRVVMVEGIPEGDLTRGHIDGFARFIDAETVVVSQCTAGSQCRSGDNATGSIYDNAAAIIAAAGFKVVRDPVLGQVRYRDRVFDTNYLNWLVGNGFVIAVGFGYSVTDTAARKRIEGYFPGREVHIIEMLASWYDGGGVHCHTNDQPAL